MDSAGEPITRWTQQHVVALLTGAPATASFSGPDEDGYRSARCRAGDVLVFPGSRSVEFGWSADVSLEVIGLAPEWLGGLGGADTTAPRSVQLHPRDQLVTALIKQIVLEGDRRNDPNDAYLNSLLTTLGRHVLRSPGWQQNQQRAAAISPNRLRQVLDHIDRHLATTITVNDLCGIVRLSPAHFNRAFREEMGTTPHRYIVLTRLDLAHELLRTTSLTVGEIAERTGFTDGAHLSRTTRAHWGLAPGDLRG